MLRNIDVPEPTADQCSKHAKVYEDDERRGYAIWYPSMGGYVGKAVAMVTKGLADACIDVYVWHDGAFPFTGENDDGQNPIDIHHCSPEEFVDFGENLLTFQTWASHLAPRKKDITKP